MLTVGEIAGQAGVTPKTVRYYEEIGLLPPARRGTNTYRYFDLDDLNRLLFIQRSKALGLTLDEIRELVTIAEGGQCSLTRVELRQILDRKIAECTQSIGELIAFRDTLEVAAHQLDLREEPQEEACRPGCASFNPSCRCVPEPVEKRG